MPTIFKDLLQNRLGNQSHICCEASMGRGMKVCVDRTGRMNKKDVTMKNLFVKNKKSYYLNTWCGAFVLVCINGDPGLTMTYFTAR